MTLYQAMGPKGDKIRLPRCAGMHLSGPTMSKTAIVILESDESGEYLAVRRIYDKIGSRGKIFSDDRVVDILRMEGPFTEVVVDAPLNSPPCVECVRPVCPGVKHCDDVAVAYMMSLAEKSELGRRRKKRPLNPQTQRLWDVLYAHESGLDHLEPTYSSNMAPLVVRSRTLQKRLQGLPMGQMVQLKETSIPHALKAMFGHLSKWENYRDFERGLEVREAIFEASLELESFGISIAAEDRYRVFATVENFHAYIAAITAAYVHAGLFWQPQGLQVGAPASIYLPHPD